MTENRFGPTGSLALRENVSAAFLAAVRCQMPEIRRTVGVANLAPALLTAAERLQEDGFQRRRQAYEIARRMANEGVPINRIVRGRNLKRLIRYINRRERRTDTTAPEDAVIHSPPRTPAQPP